MMKTCMAKDVEIGDLIIFPNSSGPLSVKSVETRVENGLQITEIRGPLNSVIKTDCGNVIELFE